MTPLLHSYSTHQMILLCVDIHLKSLLLVGQALDAEQAALQLTVLIPDHLPLFLLRSLLRGQLPIHEHL